MSNRPPKRSSEINMASKYFLKKHRIFGKLCDRRCVGGMLCPQKRGDQTSSTKKGGGWVGPLTTKEDLFAQGEQKQCYNREDGLGGGFQGKNNQKKAASISTKGALNQGISERDLKGEGG